MPKDTEELVQLAVRSLYNSKARDMILLDIADLSSFTDRFLLASATSSQHLSALSANLYHACKDQGLLPQVSGKAVSGWIVLDFGNLVVHLFLDSTRKFYELEEFWHQAEQLDLQDYLPLEAEPDPGLSSEE